MLPGRVVLYIPVVSLEGHWRGHEDPQEWTCEREIPVFEGLNGGEAIATWLCLWSRRTRQAGACIRTRLCVHVLRRSDSRSEGRPQGKRLKRRAGTHLHLTHAPAAAGEQEGGLQGEAAWVIQGSNTDWRQWRRKEVDAREIYEVALTVYTD